MDAFARFSNLYSDWILWNLFLAAIPLSLSLWLFRRRRITRGALWWMMLGLYAAFLPNAPYMLTDVVHLFRGARQGVPTWQLTLVILPLHAGAIVAGFEAYVAALLNQARYLRRIGGARWIVPMELGTHAVCAVGIYLGRFRRFNSWDLVRTPGNVLANTVNDLTAQEPLLVTGIIFVILAMAYWVMREVTLGIMLRIRFARGDVGIRR